MASTTFKTHENNATTTLATGINDSITTVVLAAGGGAEFPSGTTFWITIFANGNTPDDGNEIMLVASRSTDTLTITTRGDQSTSAAAWVAGDTIKLLWTKEDITDITGAINNIEDGTTDLATLSVGGGYGATGLDVTAAGNLSMNGNLVVDGTSTLTGNTTVTGDLAVNGADITTTATAFNLINATALTLNIGAGASTATNIGHASGTVTSLGIHNIGSTGTASTIKGTLNCDEAVTMDTTLGVTGISTLTGNIVTAGELVINGSASDINIEMNDTVTDTTSKSSRIAMTHYTTAEEPMAIIFGQSSGTTNRVNIGGGTGTMNAATEIKLYTAATQTTVTGTTAVTINSTQDATFAGDIDLAGNLAFDTSADQNINFGDGGDADIGRIRYQHSTDTLSFYAGATLAVSLISTQFFLNPGTGVDVRIDTDNVSNALFIDASADTVTFAAGITANGSANTLGNASTDVTTCTGRLLVRTVSDAGPMTATGGTQREMVFNSSDSLFYGCTVTHASAATWVAF